MMLHLSLRRGLGLGSLLQWNRRYSSSNEVTELIYRKCTSSDLKLIKETLKLIMTAAPEARQLVIARASPQLARHVKWFGNWIIQLIAGERSIAITIQHVQSNDLCVGKEDTHILKNKRNDTRVQNLADLMVKARELSVYRKEQESNTSAYSISTVKTITTQLQRLESEEYSKDKISLMDIQSSGYFLAEILSHHLPDSILHKLIEALHSYPSHTPDAFINEVYTILDIHRHYLQYLMCFIGLKGDQVMKNKMLQAEQAYQRNFESLENTIDLFLSQIPIWRQEDQALFDQIKMCFDSNVKNKVLNKTSSNPPPSTVRYTVSHYLCLQLKCQANESMTDSLEYDISHKSNGFIPAVSAVNGYDQEDDDDLDTVVVPDDDPTLKLIVLNLPKTITSVELALAFRNCGVISENWLANVEDEVQPPLPDAQPTDPSSSDTMETIAEATKPAEKDSEEDEVQVNADGTIEENPTEENSTNTRKRGRKKKSAQPMMSAVHVLDAKTFFLLLSFC